jgi:hypothetical protein
MSQEAGWILEQMVRIRQAERLAEAARYRMVTPARGTYTSPRMRLAKALRSLAEQVDGEVDTTTQPKRRGAGAF